MPNQEQERLKRLRDRQLTERDPLAHQRQFQRMSSIKEKRVRKPFSFAKSINDIPHIVKAPFYGLLLGILVIFVLPLFWNSKWTLIAGAGATLIFIIFGLIVGNALNLRDNIKDHLK